MVEPKCIISWGGGIICHCKFFYKTAYLNGGLCDIIAMKLIIALIVAGDMKIANVALRKPCRQVDVRDNGVASRAVDGNRDGNFAHGSCCLTGYHMEPWWMVDLLQVRHIISVVITSRTDKSS